eukprot:3087413-Amphidinium_carterae.1
MEEYALEVESSPAASGASSRKRVLSAEPVAQRVPGSKYTHAKIARTLIGGRYHQHYHDHIKMVKYLAKCREIMPACTSFGYTPNKSTVLVYESASKRTGKDCLCASIYAGEADVIAWSAPQELLHPLSTH